MRVSGFTIVRNGVRFGYPFQESIRSLLPLVDEMIVAIGTSSDGTIEGVRDVRSPKIRVVETTWDLSKREGGRLLAEQTDLALAECAGDWCFYLQADEVVHERDYPRLRQAMRRYLPRPAIEGLWFSYVHFRAGYDVRDTLGYRRAVRIVRNGVGIRSRADACTFWGSNGRPLHPRWPSGTRRAGGEIYHYGGVRPSRQQGIRRASLEQMYDEGRMGDSAPEQEIPDWTYDYRGCVPFQGTHPAVMSDRIAAMDWERPPFHPVPRWRDSYWWRVRLRKAGVLPRGWVDWP